MNSVAQAGIYLFAAFGLVSMLVAIMDRLATFNRFRSRPAVSLVIAFKDKENIVEGLLRGVLNFRIFAESLDYEVIAVDDHSTDCTAEILERLSRRFSNLKVVRMDEANVRGTAIDVGLFLARSPVSVICDARGPIDLSQVLETLFWLLGPSPHRRKGGITQAH